MPPANKDSFEACIGKLEEIVEKLEEPDLALDQALKLFEDGIKQARSCESRLREAEGKVEKLIEENEAFKKEPLEL